MKLTVSKKSFVKALATVKAGVSGRTTLPILSHVLIRTFEKSVELVCTDLDLYLRERLDAGVKEKGCLTVSAGLLHSIVSRFPEKEGDADIRLELVKGTLRITCGDAKYNLGILDAEEFPPMPRIKDGTEFKLPQRTLRELLQTTSYPGNDADESRYVLCGTLLATNGKISAVATDGRRLAEMTVDIGQKLPKSETIIPRRAISTLLPLLADDGDANVTVTIGDNNISFAFGETVITSKVIEGNYPNWRQVIPDLRDAGNGVPVGRADLLAVIERVSLVGGNINFDFRQQLLTVSSRSEDKDVPGDATECLLIPRCRAGSVNANARYFLQVLKAVTDDEVLFFNTGKSSPIVLKAKDKPWQAVIMPMRSSESVNPEPEATQAKPEATPAGVES
jgi:DNA polymerase-3 subunit beta